MPNNEPCVGFTVFQATCLGRATNCEYPHEMRVTDEESLKLAVRRDYVCARYRDARRSVSNFIEADCVAMDVDNDHANESDEWVKPEDVHRQFPDVTLGVHFSRHHMKPKKGETARPRFHVLMLCDREQDADRYAQLKERLHQVFPYFDANARDAARFFFGTKDGDCSFYPGTITINECLDRYCPEDDSEPFDKDIPLTIPEGKRNATLSHFAGRVLKRLGDTSEAHEAFMLRAELCDPPLEERELETIWRSAQGFYERISKRDDYVPPEQWNTEQSEQFLYDPDDRTDVGQAELIGKLFRDELRYAPEMEFIHYTGVLWEESLPAAQGVAHRLTALQLQEALTLRKAAEKGMADTGADEVLATRGKNAKAHMNPD